MLNWIAIKTLIVRELKRSFRVPIQVFGAPIITGLLYFLVFGSSVGSRIGSIGGLSYSEFIMPGLILMNVVITTFLSVSSTFMLAKVMNVLSDLLVTPISNLEMVLGLSIPSVIRGLIIAGLIYLVALFFIPVTIIHPLYLITFLIIVSAIFSFLGLTAGIWATTFEQMNVFPTFLITPLSFLGGVFYSIEMLPENFQMISKLNPFLYLVSGMRYGFYGISDVHPIVSYLIAFGIMLLAGIWAWYLLKIGYKIRN
jgi:ABC-2 type transport system permease protein